jgi:arylsulfatase A-like enzyme
MMKRFFSGYAAAGLSAALAVSRSAAAEAPVTKPNFVVIYVDDMDFDELTPYNEKKFPCYTGAREAGCYNPPDSDNYFVQTHWMLPGERTWFENPKQYTPNLDRMVREGMQFNRFYVTSSICTPSRYSLLTGQYASRCPALKKTSGQTLPNIRWNTPITPGEDNLVKQLDRLGYTTALFCKWHNWFYDVGAEEPYTWERIYPEIDRDADPRDPAVLAKIHAGYERAIRHLKENIGFDVVGGLYAGNIYQSGLPHSLQSNNLEWDTRLALDFLKQQPSDQPFFLYFPINLPHRQNTAFELKEDPLATPDGLLEKAPQPFASRDDLLARMKEHGVDPQQFCSTWIDASVGAILETLADRGMTDNTLVLFISDHQSRGKFTCYEGVRVPAVAFWPKTVPAGSVCTDLCANIDIAPTLVALAGGKVDADGQDLSPVLKGKTPAGWRSSLLLEVAYTRALVTPRWKYILNNPPPFVIRKMEEDRMASIKEGRRRHIGWDGERSGDTAWGVRYGVDDEFPAYFDREQLYDLNADVFEQTNLVNEAGANEARAEMRILLEKEMNGIQ